MKKSAISRARIMAAAGVVAVAPLAQVVLAAPATRPAAARAQADPGADAEANAALADRLTENAFAIMRATPFAPPMWRQAVALYRAATRLNPDEPRYWRLRIEAELAIGAGDAAVEALNAYRQIVPDDQWAQAQLIELYLTRLQGADAKVRYVRNLIDRESVPADVRAHAAMLGARLLLERSNADALAMANKALELNPLNPQALRMRFDLSAASAAPPQRLAAILALLRGSPVQPLAIEEVARILCVGGLNDQALDWYSRALDLYQQSGGMDPDHFHDMAIEYAAQLYMAGRDRESAKYVSDLLQANPDDVDAWFLRLLIEGNGADASARANLLQSAEQALTNRWSAIAKLAADAPAASQPAAAAGDDRGGDLASVTRRLRAADNPDLSRAATLAAADLAWFELYFNEQPASAQKWIDVLRAILVKTPGTLERLAGWQELLDKKPDAAQKTLTPLADSDPLAALGLIRLAGPQKENDPASAQADRLAGRLLGQYRTGLTGALVWSALRGRNVSAALPADAQAALRAELAKFPREWLDVVRDPKQFYQLRIEPIRVAAPFHEPMYARISIQNTGNMELTVGDDGVVRRDIWVDALLLGPERKAFSGVAFDRLAGPMRLRAGQSITQVVRIDQGALGDFLASNPTPTFQVEASVISNPLLTADGSIPGPAGRLATATRRVARIGFNVGSEPARRKVIDELDIGLPANRFRYLDLMATYVAMLRGAQPPQPEARPVIDDFTRKITGVKDGAAATTAWAMFLSARLAPTEQQAQIVGQMAKSPAWESRLLALLAADNLPFAQRKQIAAELADHDADPAVRLFAEATLDLLNHPTTGPTTAPTSKPATQPARSAILGK